MSEARINVNPIERLGQAAIRSYQDGYPDNAVTALVALQAIALPEGHELSIELIRILTWSKEAEKEFSLDQLINRFKEIANKVQQSANSRDHAASLKVLLDALNIKISPVQQGQLHQDVPQLKALTTIQSVVPRVKKIPPTWIESQNKGSLSLEEILDQSNTKNPDSLSTLDKVHFCHSVRHYVITSSQTSITRSFPDPSNFEKVYAIILNYCVSEDEQVQHEAYECLKEIILSLKVNQNDWGVPYLFQALLFLYTTGQFEKALNLLQTAGKFTFSPWHLASATEFIKRLHEDLQKNEDERKVLFILKVIAQFLKYDADHLTRFFNDPNFQFSKEIFSYLISLKPKSIESSIVLAEIFESIAQSTAYQNASQRERLNARLHTFREEAQKVVQKTERALILWNTGGGLLIFMGIAGMLLLILMGASTFLVTNSFWIAVFEALPFFLVYLGAGLLVFSIIAFLAAKLSGISNYFEQKIIQAKLVIAGIPENQLTYLHPYLTDSLDLNIHVTAWLASYQIKTDTLEDLESAFARFPALVSYINLKNDADLFGKYLFSSDNSIQRLEKILHGQVADLLRTALRAQEPADFRTREYSTWMTQKFLPNIIRLVGAAEMDVDLRRYCRDLISATLYQVLWRADGALNHVFIRCLIGHYPADFNKILAYGSSGDDQKISAQLESIFSAMSPEEFKNLFDYLHRSRSVQIENSLLHQFVYQAIKKNGAYLWRLLTFDNVTNENFFNHLESFKSVFTSWAWYGNANKKTDDRYFTGEAYQFSEPDLVTLLLSNYEKVEQYMQKVAPKQNFSTLFPRCRVLFEGIGIMQLFLRVTPDMVPSGKTIEEVFHQKLEAYKQILQALWDPSSDNKFYFFTVSHLLKVFEYYAKKNLPNFQLEPLKKFEEFLREENKPLLNVDQAPSPSSSTTTFFTNQESPQDSDKPVLPQKSLRTGQK